MHAPADGFGIQLMVMTPLASWRLLVGCSVAAVLATARPAPALAHDLPDDVARLALVSAFAPDLAILRDDLSAPTVHSLNGLEFLTGTPDRLFGQTMDKP